MLQILLGFFDYLRVIADNTRPMLRSRELIRQGVKSRELTITRLRTVVTLHYTLEGAHDPVHFRVPWRVISQYHAYDRVAGMLADSPDLPPNIDRDALHLRYRTELEWLVGGSVGAKLIFGSDGNCRRG